MFCNIAVIYKWLLQWIMIKVVNNKYITQYNIIFVSIV